MEKTEKFPVFSHYCDDEQNKLFTAFSLKDKTSRKYDVPYETIFLFDSAQTMNMIFFTGGGLPASSSHEQVFFKTCACVTILPSLDAKTDVLHDMLDPRANHTLVSLNDKQIYAIGGCNNSGDLALCEMFNITKNEWTRCASLSEPKIWVSVCPFNNQYLYAFGGGCSHDSEKITKTIEFYDTSDLSQKTWTKITLELGKEYWGSCIFMGTMQITAKSILVFGGNVNKVKSAACYIFTPNKKSLIKCGNLVKEDEFYRTKPQILLNELMIVGSGCSDLHIYNITNRTWGILEKNVWNPEVTFHLKSETY